VKTLGVAETPSSILVDERDRRVCSPFNHGLHPVAAHANLNSESTRGTESSFNVKNGYAFSLFLSKTTKDDKFQFVVSMDYPEGFRCSNQDDKSNLKIFQRERFYPMDIPQMFDKSPTLVRVKIWAAMEKGEIGTLVNQDGSKTLGPAGMYLLVDLTLIGYKGDKDMSIETFKVHESTVNKFRGTNLTKTLDKNGDLYWKEAGKYKSKDVEKNGVLTVTIAVFRADQRISAITFSDSGKLYRLRATARWSKQEPRESCSNFEGSPRRQVKRSASTVTGSILHISMFSMGLRLPAISRLWPDRVLWLPT
jgi:hypothetical protein